MCGRKSSPGYDGEARIGEAAISATAQHRQVIAVLAPGDARVQLIARIECSKRAGRDIEQLEGIASLTLDVYGHGEERSILVPREVGDVAEGDVSGLLQITDDEIGTAATPIGRDITTERDVGAVLAQRERLDILQYRASAIPQVDDADFVACYLRRRRASAPTGRAATTRSSAGSGRVRCNREQQPPAVGAEQRRIA